MKLWLLRPVDGLANHDNPWNPWYDKAFGSVIRAETETEARALAKAAAGDENRKGEPWLDAKYSTCVELTAEGPAEVVMEDFYSA